MKKRKEVLSPSLSVFIGFISLMNIASCTGGDGDPGLVEGRIISAGSAGDRWPNETTSDPSSSQIVSSILVSDLDDDGEFENIFLSVLPNSSNKKTSILRVTRGENYTEVSNFKSSKVFFHHDSIPFSKDLNGDARKELFFVGHDLDEVHSLQFKNEELSQMQVRWRAQLPSTLDEGFDPKLMTVVSQGQEMIKVDQYGLYEYKNKKVKVVDLSQEGGSSGDDDDD